MHREMSFRWIGLSVVVALMLSVGGVGCKQGEGDRCQINDDCEDGLVCNASEQICQQPGSDTPDARLNIDSGPAVDAGTADAMVPDAFVPDAFVPDAMVNDAMVIDAP